jgi:hypothetical protein
MLAKSINKLKHIWRQYSPMLLAGRWYHWSTANQCKQQNGLMEVGMSLCIAQNVGKERLPTHHTWHTTYPADHATAKTRKPAPLDAIPAFTAAQHCASWPDAGRSWSYGHAPVHSATDKHVASKLLACKPCVTLDTPLHSTHTPLYCHCRCALLPGIQA